MSLGLACCVTCRAEFFKGLEPDPCLGWIPGLDFACCGHGIAKGYPEDDEYEESYVDTCYFVSGWGTPEQACVYSAEARRWLRAIGLAVPEVNRSEIEC